MPVTMSDAEKQLVDAYLDAAAKNNAEFSFGVPDKATVEVERKSGREFDLTVRYRDTNRMLTGAWLPLGCIREMTKWTTPAIANMTDYPTMARHGDWSGVRDSEVETIWAIFTKHVLDKRK
jgi:hypothetical protein